MFHSKQFPLQTFYTTIKREKAPKEAAAEKEGSKYTGCVNILLKLAALLLKWNEILLNKEVIYDICDEVVALDKLICGRSWNLKNQFQNI